MYTCLRKLVLCVNSQRGGRCVHMQKRMNLTKTIRKLPIDEEGQRAGYYVHDDLSSLDIKYDEPKVCDLLKT